MGWVLGFGVSGSGVKGDREVRVKEMENEMDWEMGAGPR